MAGRLSTPDEPPFTLDIEALDAEGRGVGHRDGKVVFVAGALPGETVTARVVRRRARFDTARLESVLVAGAGRRPARCPHFGICGGCVTQHAEPRTQLAARQRWLEDCLARIGRVSPETMLPILYGPEWGYRRRARLTVRRVAKKGGVLVGFHERGSSYVADMHGCEVLPDAVGALIDPLRAMIDTLTVRERLPQVEVACGDQVTVLVFRHLEPLAESDRATLGDFARAYGVQAWLQPGGPDTAAPLAPLDAPPLDYALPEFGLRIAFRPTEFTQVNHEVNRVLVSRAVRLLGARPGERVADFFCGLGNFSLPLACTGVEVHGIEGSAALVARARENALANGLAGRASFSAGNLLEVTPERLAAFGRFDRWLIDPPRDGALALVRSIGAGGPQRILYVSCDPATLARDAGVLVHVQGYRLREAGVVNMFPHTAHVESMAVFERG